MWQYFDIFLTIYKLLRMEVCFQVTDSKLKSKLNPSKSIGRIEDEHGLINL